jgi:hypothetical protein
MSKSGKSKKNKLPFPFQSCFEIWAAGSDKGLLCQLSGKHPPRSLPGQDYNS